MLSGAGGLIVVLAVGLVLALSGHDQAEPRAAGFRPGPTPSPSPTPSPTPSATPTPSLASGACAYPTKGLAAKPVNGTPPVTQVERVRPYSVTFNTNRGQIDLALDTSLAPCTVNNFTFLAKQKYFDGTSCHRLTTSGIFLFQCGDPSGLGTGGPGYTFGDENLEGATYPPGTVAMANPGSNGSQFILIYQQSKLPPIYTPFGTITRGIDVLTKVAAGGSDPEGDGEPKLPIILGKVIVQ